MDERLKEIIERLSEIANAMEKRDSNFDELKGESDELLKEKREIEKYQAGIAEVRSQIATGKATVAPVAETIPGGEERKKEYDASSPEYRSAFLKEAARKGGLFFGELTAEERAAYTALTTNVEEVVPTILQNRIIDLVEKETAIYADLTIQGFDKIFEVPRFKAIVKGDAAKTAENVANKDDEENEFDLITLTGEEFKKHAKLSRKMSIQSIDAFETWLVSHIAKRILFAMNAYVYTQLDKTDVGIQAGNLFTPAELNDVEICKALAAVRGGALKAYANRATIYNHIAQVKDENKRPIYTETSMSDPRTAGVMRGVVLRVDDSLADGVIYIGDPSRIEANLFDAISVSSDVNVTSREITYGGYALFDCVLAYPDGFAKITITGAGA